MDSHTAEIAEIQERLTAKGADLSQLASKHRKQAVELIRVKLLNTAGATVLDDLELVAENCERSNKRPMVTHKCRKSYTTSHTAGLSAPLVVGENYKNRSEALTVEVQFVSGFVAEVKKQREKLVDCEKTDVASKTTLKGQKKRATAAEDRVDTLKTGLARAKAFVFATDKVFYVL